MEILRTLLEAGVDNTKVEGETALYAACESATGCIHCCAETVKILLQYGATDGRKDDGYLGPILRTAATWAGPETVLLLLNSPQCIKDTRKIQLAILAASIELEKGYSSNRAKDIAASMSILLAYAKDHNIPELKEWPSDEILEWPEGDAVPSRVPNPSVADQLNLSFVIEVIQLDV